MSSLRHKLGIAARFQRYKLVKDDELRYNVDSIPP